MTAQLSIPPSNGVFVNLESSEISVTNVRKEQSMKEEENH